jgi:hypothetical protein
VPRSVGQLNVDPVREATFVFELDASDVPALIERTIGDSRLDSLNLRALISKSAIHRRDAAKKHIIAPTKPPMATPLSGAADEAGAAVAANAAIAREKMARTHMTGDLASSNLRTEFDGLTVDALSLMGLILNQSAVSSQRQRRACT